MSPEERKVLGFVALLLALSIGARWLDRPPAVVTDARPVDVAGLLREAGAEPGPRSGGGPRERVGSGPGTGAEAAARIDPNRAGADELQRLPGVGAATAAAIIAFRDSAGPFRRAEDLLGVRGIGPARLARMRDRLTLP